MLDKKKVLAITGIVLLLIGIVSLVAIKNSNKDTADSILNTAKKSATSTDTQTDTGAGSTDTTTGNANPGSTVATSAVGPTKITEVRDNNGGNIENKFTNYVTDLLNYGFNTFQTGKVETIDDMNKAAAATNSKVFTNVAYFTIFSKNPIQSLGVVADIGGGKICQTTIEPGKDRESTKVLLAKCVMGSVKDVVAAANAAFVNGNQKQTPAPTAQNSKGSTK